MHSFPYVAPGATPIFEHSPPMRDRRGAMQLCKEVTREYRAHPLPLSRRGSEELGNTIATKPDLVKLVSVTIVLQIIRNVLNNRLFRLTGQQKQACLLQKCKQLAVLQIFIKKPSTR